MEGSFLIASPCSFYHTSSARLSTVPTAQFTILTFPPLSLKPTESQMLCIQISLLGIWGQCHSLPLCCLFTKSRSFWTLGDQDDAPWEDNTGQKKSSWQLWTWRYWFRDLSTFNRLSVILRNHQMVPKFQTVDIQMMPLTLLLMTGNEPQVPFYTLPSHDWYRKYCHWIYPSPTLINSVLLTSESSYKKLLYLGTPHHFLEEIKKTESMPHQRNEHSEHIALGTNYRSWEQMSIYRKLSILRKYPW